MNPTVATIDRPPGATAPDPSGPALPRRRRPVALVVEDDPHIRGLVRYILAAEEMCVLTAADGTEAMATTLAARPEIILLDLMLPGMSGYDVCARLRADPATRDVPVLILTACDRSSDVELAWAVGADDYIAKPFRRRDLVRRVRRLLPQPG